MDFYDKDGFTHDTAEADSNNKWIYSAYDRILNSRIVDFWKQWHEHLAPIEDKVYYIYRHIADKFPPLSRDEAIGMDILQMPIYRLIKDNDFYLVKKEIVDQYTYLESVVDLIKVAWKRRNLKGSRKRNYIWENGHFAAMKISEKLLPHDRYWFKVRNYEKPTMFETIMFNVYSLQTSIKKDYSARNVCWVQLKTINDNFWLKFINQVENFKEYFPANHPFNKGNL